MSARFYFRVDGGGRWADGPRRSEDVGGGRIYLRLCVPILKVRLGGQKAIPQKVAEAPHFILPAAHPLSKLRIRLSFSLNYPFYRLLIGKPHVITHNRLWRFSMAEGYEANLGYVEAIVAILVRYLIQRDGDDEEYEQNIIIETGVFSDVDTPDAVQIFKRQLANAKKNEFNPNEIADFAKSLPQPLREKAFALLVNAATEADNTAPDAELYHVFRRAAVTLTVPDQLAEQIIEVARIVERKIE
jgi:hypothetical protein